ncbi:MAG: lipid-A-disaccharide synthase [Candidatus Saganbacteria bacterium]|nr:lipid-A-disaccharide synthase [Candidatus Saganbacteria bacterium]
MGMKIMISAGEVSGDVHGAHLVNELKKLRPDAEFFGVGSGRLAAAGVDVRFDISRRGTIGIFEALPNLLPLLAAFRQIKKMVLAEKPDLVILIDSQGINFPLAKFCKKAGLKTVYYIAPQEWLWGTPKNVKLVAETVGLIVAIFPKELAAYKKAGANVVYFGHPLVDIVKPTMSREAARAKFAARGAKYVISLCPGSRTQELKTLWPVLSAAARLIAAQLPGTKFIVPSALRAGPSFAPGDFPVVHDDTYNALSCSDLALCASGTINLEASLLGIPNIMAYKLSWPTYLIGKYLLKIDKKIKYFSMPNILLDEKIIPELVMGDATPRTIAAAALEILRDPDRQAAMKKAFARLKTGLGAPGAVRRAASAIVNFAAA